jgi:hypothetical protein
LFLAAFLPIANADVDREHHDERSNDTASAL